MTEADAEDDDDDDIFEGRTSKWFGPSWGAPVCTPESRIETPEAPCCQCHGKFRPEDRGIMLPHIGRAGDPRELPYHHECLMWCLGLSHTHILLHGQSLCGFMPGDVPAAWPKDHSWVYLHEWRRANCPVCRQEGEKRQAQVA